MYCYQRPFDTGASADSISIATLARFVYDEAVQPFSELKVWQRSHALVLQIYKLTREFPADERFGRPRSFAVQRHRCPPVPTNIVEGSRRQHRQDFARFLNIAEGSLGEVDYLLMLSRDLDYVDEETTRALIDEANEIARMLYALCLTTAAEPLPTFAASVREPASLACWLVGCGSAAL